MTTCLNSAIVGIATNGERHQRTAGRCLPDRQSGVSAQEFGASDRSRSVAPDAGEGALAALIAKAFVKVDALAACRRGAQRKIFHLAKHAVEELLPFHVGGVSCRETRKALRHQAVEFAAV